MISKPFSQARGDCICAQLLHALELTSILNFVLVLWELCTWCFNHIYPFLQLFPDLIPLPYPLTQHHFLKPLKTSLCHPNVFEWVTFPWRVIDLSGATLWENHLPFPAALNCWYLYGYGNQPLPPWWDWPFADLVHDVATIVNSYLRDEMASVIIKKN